ncbi:MAG TPA: metalloregulator ArsR/SmtB family transcription factor [Thermoanaerobaculia bacterium]|jgi:DNA-binding transcriptional ArsR family regulator|nr:metalloregulator ArsR/SmtB family transcription factor [Thermoanaerobaculia bacterium]
MKGEAPKMSSKEMAQVRQNLESTPDIEEAAELMSLAGNATRLKLIYLLQNTQELGVCELAEKLSISVSATSQHLAKLKAHGLVAPRRDAQTIYYRLTDHTFNGKLRENFLGQIVLGTGEREGGPFPYCFPAWTRVVLADGTDRPISELLPGDLVRAWDRGRAMVAPGRVARVVTGTATRLILVNGGLAASPNHRILTARGYVPFGEVETGDQLVSNSDGEAQAVREIEVLHGVTVVYNLEVVPYASFFAEGLVVEDYTGEEQVDEGSRAAGFELERVVASAARC